MNTLNVQGRAQVAHSGKRLFVWLKRGLTGVIIVVILLCITGVIYQAIGAAADQRDFPPPGQLVDVGGYRLHLHCLGEGSPTVVLEALSGGTSINWGWVQPEIAPTTRVCAYDRAGRAWSEASANPQSARQVVQDLHTLLSNAGISGPYVLVGHSIGGIYVRTYAADYPDQVVGLVLLDASHAEQLDRHPEYLTANEAYLQQSAVFPALARLGLFRLYFATGGEIDFAGLPPEQHAQMVALWSSPAYFHSQRAETMAGPQIFAQAQDELGNLGNLPLVVISAGANTPSGWAALQEELATLSSDSVHQVIPDATHQSLAFNRDHARLTSAGILQIVAAVRAGRPLASK